MRLEEAIYRIKIHKECAGLENGTCIVNIKDLETLLKEQERLQEENKMLKRTNCTYANSLIKMTPVLLEDYIPKKTIKEKIEKLKQNISEFEQTDNTGRFKKENSIDYYKIEVLKELLEEK